MKGQDSHDPVAHLPVQPPPYLGTPKMGEVPMPAPCCTHCQTLLRHELQRLERPPCSCQGQEPRINHQVNSATSRTQAVLWEPGGHVSSMATVPGLLLPTRWRTCKVSEKSRSPAPLTLCMVRIWLGKNPPPLGSFKLFLYASVLRALVCLQSHSSQIRQ